MGNIYIDYSYRAGEKYITNEGYEVEIIKYRNKKDCTIKIGNNIIEGIRYGHIKRGNIKNPYHKSVFGVGYFGEGEHKSKALNKNTKKYNRWNSMFERCYDKKFQEKRHTYVGCSVDERWHNFQNFGDWYDKNFNDETMEDWALDKDILIKGNKIYSPETCCFVPQEINCLFTKSNSKRGEYPIGVSLHKGGKFQAKIKKYGKVHYLGTFITPKEAFQAYKVAKEDWIKEVADKWRGQITEEVYNAMYKYQVEITD